MTTERETEALAEDARFLADLSTLISGYLMHETDVIRPSFHATAIVHVISPELARRDAAMRAAGATEAGERIAQAIEAKVVPVSDEDVNGGGFEVGMDVGCEIAYSQAARIARADRLEADQ